MYYKNFSFKEKNIYTIIMGNAKIYMDGKCTDIIYVDLDIEQLKGGDTSELINTLYPKNDWIDVCCDTVYYNPGNGLDVVCHVTVV